MFRASSFDDCCLCVGCLVEAVCRRKKREEMMWREESGYVARVRALDWAQCKALWGGRYHCSVQAIIASLLSYQLTHVAY